MAFTELFESGERSRKLSHFASIVRMAMADGVVNDDEKRLLKRFALKLDVSEDEFKKITKNPKIYPMNPSNSAEDRLERMLDLFKIIFADNEIDDEEKRLVERYAIGLGYTEELAAKLISRSIRIFKGGLDMEDYRYLLNRK
ncbi:MAG: TerB family tellurite resistance protein [Bacteroidia bacterium]|nr:TerB family tellurite resistance protein [Bacteroidia bacterium]NNF30688.1 TerB family tellurite resistance protein [Flavobacteriaceae bacterium]MBT8277267.1 TerB family tellurite resistance protein [Bacteroidia bacterium]NNJ80792.1 TerB family tellurite resistance protein [Flavobacteriaceae bacterium]NNK54867.1 TerB family tellurite resistance protein [Flavobacteriaceae bacterium]